MSSDVSFDLSSVLRTVAKTLPDHEVLIWRDQRCTYAQMNARIDGVAHYLAGRAGLPHRARRAGRARVRPGPPRALPAQRQRVPRGDGRRLPRPGRAVQRQLPLRRGRAALPAHRRAAKALVYGAEFAPQVAAIRDRLPDAAGAHPGRRRLRQRPAARRSRLRVDRRHARAGRPACPLPTATTSTSSTPAAPPACRRACCGASTTSSCPPMGGRPFGTDDAVDVLRRARRAGPAPTRASRSMLMIPPLMHGAAQWAAFNMVTTGGWIVIPDDVDRLDAADGDAARRA